MQGEMEELCPSDLGTLEFWENVYSRELDNFKDHGDIGEVWFGRRNALKVVHWITSQLNVDKEEKIIDIGCGNGATLLELGRNGFRKLLGIDYSAKAIELAKEVLKENDLRVELRVCDILADENGLEEEFKVIHDKGTYDAISLHPEDSASKRRKYVQNVDKILRADGYLLLTSCNWTKEELEKHFEGYFFVDTVLPADSFQFGGQKGNTVTQLVLKKK